MSLNDLGSHDDVSIPGLYPLRGTPRKLGEIEKFAISGVAPAVAVLFTNPFDTAKVRLQLQGENSRRNLKSDPPNKNNVIYKNTFDTLSKIYRNEGIRGLQKGIAPAILREGSKNTFRLGLYDPMINILHDRKKGSAPGWKRVVAGSLCGVAGAVACNPFELVKTRLQSSSSGAILVGHQHNYTGVMDGLRSIVQQDGFRGLYRGSVLSMSRSIVGSGANLSSFTMIKEWFMESQQWTDSWFLDMISGLGSSVFSVALMNPIDVTRTRYYNQQYVNGKGQSYKNGIEAVQKIILNEGFTALYKGVTTHFLRLGPHFCFSFVFLGVFRRWILEGYDFLDRRDSFRHFDKNGDSFIDTYELVNALKTVFPSYVLSSEDPDEYDKLINTFRTRILSAVDIKEDTKINWANYPAVVSEMKAICKEYKAEQV